MIFKNTKLIGSVIIFTVIIGLLAISAMPASAQVTGLTNKPISDIVADIIDWLLTIVAGLTILFIIIGGIFYVTAAGDDNQMSKGKMIITYSIIGLLFILISYSIVLTVNSMIN